MWTTLALTAVLTAAPAQEELNLANPRPTHGFLGAPRKDGDAPKLLAGDAFFVSFDIENLKTGPDGRVQYSMGMELTDKNGKVQFRKEPEKLEAYNSLGGRRVPGFVATEVGTDTPPGEYTLTAIVTDLAAKTTKKLETKFEVVPTTFGLVRLGLSYDERGLYPAPPAGVPGQRMMINFFATGFSRDEKGKQPNISVSMRVLENGRPTLEKDVTGAVKEAPESYKLIPMTFILNLNRAGKYTVELKATDEITKKTASQSFDVTVADLK